MTTSLWIEFQVGYLKGIVPVVAVEASQCHYHVFECKYLKLCRPIIIERPNQHVRRGPRLTGGTLPPTVVSRDPISPRARLSNWKCTVNIVADSSILARSEGHGIHSILIQGQT